MDTGSNYNLELSLSEVHQCNGGNDLSKKNHKLKLEARAQIKRDKRKEECPVKKNKNKNK